MNLFFLVPEDLVHTSFLEISALSYNYSFNSLHPILEIP